MSYRFSLADVGALAAAEAELAALDAQLGLTPATQLADVTAARRMVGRLAPAAVELLTLRRRAVPRLGPSASKWLFTDEALQQATPLAVAVHRAQRLAGLAVHDVTCSIGADLVALRGSCPLVLGSDLDEVRVAMAAHNAGGGVVVADALRPVSLGLLPYADPARRADGRRILTTETIPSIADLDAAWAHRPPVLRVPPGIDYEALARPGEVEVVSLDGSVREAVLWPAELAAAHRRASVLSSAKESYQLTDADPDEAQVRQVGAWLVDPDPAVVRSHLVRQFGFRHELGLIDPHLAYLTGDRPPAVGRAFRVLESAPLRERTVAGWLRAAGVGTLEIKVRGVSVDPDRLRVRLRSALSRDTRTARTLVIARVGDSRMAYLTEAVAPPEPGPATG